MQTSQSLGIHFTTRPDKAKDGKEPIYACVTVNRQRAYIALKQNVDPKDKHPKPKPKPLPLPTAKADATSRSSNISKVEPKKKDNSMAANLTPRNPDVLRSGSYYDQPVNNQDMSNPNTAASISKGVIDGYPVGQGAAALKVAFTATATAADVATLFHATTTDGAASSILNNGINPAFFNSASRFGGALYMSNDMATTAAEVSYHGVSVVNTIQVSSEGANFMNATSPAMNIGVKYAPNVMSGAARAFGYDGIMYNSLRGAGTNVAQFSNFGTLTGGRVVP